MWDLPLHCLESLLLIWAIEFWASVVLEIERTQGDMVEKCNVKTELLDDMRADLFSVEVDVQMERTS